MLENASRGRLGDGREHPSRRGERRQSRGHPSSVWMTTGNTRVAEMSGGRAGNTRVLHGRIPTGNTRVVEMSGGRAGNTRALYGADDYGGREHPSLL